MLNHYFSCLSRTKNETAFDGSTFANHDFEFVRSLDIKSSVDKRRKAEKKFRLFDEKNENFRKKFQKAEMRKRVIFQLSRNS